MSIIIGNLEFVGPFDDSKEIEKEPGLYALFCEQATELELIELDESDCVGDCLSNLRLLPGEDKVVAAVHYTKDISRAARILLRDQILKESDLTDPDGPGIG
jgi:hypothetical protein